MSPEKGLTRAVMALQPRGGFIEIVVISWSLALDKQTSSHLQLVNVEYY